MGPVSEREKKRVETMKARYGNDVFTRWGKKANTEGYFKTLKREDPEKFWDIIRKRDEKRKKK